MLVDEYNHRQQAAKEESLTYAYYTAAWQRSKKMPPLKKVLENSRPKESQMPQTPEQMLAVVKRMHQAITRGEG
ncbi:hypothetical protein [Cohnella massiliensis]|uniref:hypothetical protein n=1 Tax=Cohnella massiliensis TaxID=1816691 RepID=UPI00111A5783|nr:hypothetical protein [Cohnella massiliensis]